MVIMFIWGCHGDNVYLGIVMVIMFIWRLLW